ncbi:MAG: PaaI family thioesterase [Rhodobacteraceae bacterium]|nr:PaaI family thioesterase [Paracoccaceae bacterium]
MNVAPVSEPINPLAMPESLASLSGLQILEKMLTGALPPPPISVSMGFTLHAINEGWAEFRGTPGRKDTNPMGTVHGGWYGTLLDSAMACAVMSKLGPGQNHTTLEYKVNIIRPIPIGMEISATANADHVGRSTGIAHGSIVGLVDGRIYATGSTTCIVVTPG